MPHGNLDHTVTRTSGFAPSSGNAGPPERQDLADGDLADGDLADGDLADGDLADGKLPLIAPLHF
jgi:hypothetical protein